jgi:hypothetical protein
MIVLDRILVNVEWDSKFPLSNVKVLPKDCSDHNPLKINSGENMNTKEHVFIFETWWLEVEGFEEVVKKASDIECSNSEPMDRWQFKIRTLRKKVKGWSRNIEVRWKGMRGKKEILVEIDMLDPLMEQAPLTGHQRVKRRVERGARAGVEDRGDKS